MERNAKKEPAQELTNVRHILISPASTTLQHHRATSYSRAPPSEHFKKKNRDNSIALGERIMPCKHNSFTA